MRIDITLAQIGAIKTMFGDDDDERALAHAIEGETDAHELISRLLAHIEAEEGVEAALKTQIENRQERKKRAADRIERIRLIIAAIVKCTGLPSIKLPEATVTLGETKAALKVTAPEAVPHKYARESWAPDMALIKAAFTPETKDLPNWLTVTEPKPVLTVRRR